MQGKGAIKFLAIIFAIACLYSLSFTYVAYRVEQNAEEFAKGDKTLKRQYLDSIASEPVYNLGIKNFTYSEVEERKLNLGLDLKGGMNLTMEVSMAELVRALSNNNPDPSFDQALQMAQKRQVSSTENFIDLFIAAYKEVAPQGSLPQLFSTPENQDRITLNSSEEDVTRFLKAEAQSAFDRSFNILRTRIDKYGVSQPNIQKMGSNRIAVELPGVDDPLRVSKLLQGSAKLEFWKTYDNQEIIGSLTAANNSLAALLKSNAATADTSKSTVSDETAATKSDTSNADQSLLEQLSDNSTESDTGSAAMAANFNAQNPLFAVLTPNLATGPQGQQMPASGPTIGYAHQGDTAKVMDYLSRDEVRANFPSDAVFLWGVNPVDEKKTTFALYALKKSSRESGPVIAGDVISNARADFGQDGRPEVVMVMNNTGAQEWRNVTGEAAGIVDNENDNKSIAIVLDNTVYSAPRVQSEIAGGVSSINGSFTVEQTQDLANVLKAGRMPAPTRIVEQTVVGPTLGLESINAGLISTIVGFLSVLAFMIFYYKRAGWVANLALLINIFFLMGVLASWSAVLTLPGIAGIVLTLGMAVDANVLIYERIKEELAAGKSMSLAISDGFKHSYSAILDSNITTLITGIILWALGSGPILGFATTLVIGILTSLFTAIFITRLVFENMLKKKKTITFSTRYTEKLFKGSNFDFVASRKKFYIVSSVIIVAGLISMFTKGFGLGVDFQGGRTYIVDFTENVSTEDVRAELDKVLTDANSEVKTYGDFSQVKVTTTYLVEDPSAESTQKAADKLDEALKKVGPDYVIQKTQKVGPTVANDIKRSAVKALILALLAIVIYIAARFRSWTFGFGALVALTHDILILLSIFSIFNGILPFSLDIDQQFIAAALTVLGYSINDSVVIFDRIREYMGMYSSKNESLPTIVNKALNSTLSRTVVTGMSVIGVLIILFIFGGAILRGFSFAMLLGVIFGTYSSLFVATPVIIEFTRNKGTGKLD